MNTITIKEHVTLPDDTRVIELSIRLQGVQVCLDNLHRPGYDTAAAFLSWEQLSDVEMLSERFDTEAVRTFRVLVTMLGRTHSNRFIYEALT